MSVVNESSCFELVAVTVELPLHKLLEYDIATHAQARIDDYEYLWIEPLTLEEVVRKLAYSEIIKFLGGPTNAPDIKEIMMTIDSAGSAIIVEAAWVGLKGEPDDDEQRL